MVRDGEPAGVSVAVLSPESGGFPRHSHDEYVLSANVTGTEKVRLDRATFEAGTEDVTVYNPGQVQSCTTETPEGASWSCVSVYLHPDGLRELTGGALPEFSKPVVRAPELRAALLRAARHTGDGAARAEALSTLVLGLFDAAGRTPPAVCAPTDRRIAAVADRLRADLTAAPRLGDLANDAGLSREALIRAFTRATGSPPYAWHLQARLAEGRRLLRSGRPVAEVAHALGFADQAHFHKHFRAAYAMTPGWYRATAA
ncbi:AraC family transcriptional regulator [Amycolatopsis minnesotensis]|uniref:AraC family transcriptional regulator n=1 Tax=Amycolatopsis minnesotensis TaxID=337894 RepID=UPI0031DAF37A